ELTFPAPGISGMDFTAITLIYRLGDVGDGSANFTMYFDDIELSMSALSAPTLPIDFESTAVAYNWADFAGGVASVIANPDASGINTSATVGSMVKGAGEVFGGSTLALAGPIDFGANNQFTMKVWANAVGQNVLFKLEGANPVEISAQTTASNQWEEMVFPASGLSGQDFTAITIIYRLGEIGDGTADFTMYVDDIELSTSALPSPTLPIDFESTAVAYRWADFAGGVASVIPNPDASGINTSARVGSMVKGAGEVFGGSTLALADPIDFGTNNEFKMKVWSNAVGQSVLFKLEGANAVEIFDTTTVAGEWEELTFSAEGLSDMDFTAITIIYRLGEVGDGSADYTMYFDDIELTEVSNTVDLIDLGVSIFPNPVSTELTIQSSVDVQSVEVFNMNGQRVINNVVVTTNTLSTADLAPGTYILRVVTAEGVGTSTFVKR
ncbi:MAG: T9SS type A sorting domain-containing protein, partial [Saprospiraceae bacterium]